MRNIKLIIQYDGSRYSGWQRRPGDERTIQYKLENVISRMLDTNIEIIGAGRTDRGVHAMMQTANFHIPESAVTFTCGEMLEYINAHLPSDIAVISVSEADERFHARFNCISKTYVYRIDNRRVQDVFQSRFRTHIQEKLDVAAMKKAIKYFEGEHDFTSFTSLKSKNKSAVRTIYSAEIDYMEEDSFIDIRFCGNGFLYNMVRIISGTLIEIGLHKREVEGVPGIFSAKERAVAGYTAPPEGLVLEKTEY